MSISRDHINLQLAGVLTIRPKIQIDRLSHKYIIRNGLPTYLDIYGRNFDNKDLHLSYRLRDYNNFTVGDGSL